SNSCFLCCLSQVDRLVILHEEAEDGNAMPDLSRPVGAVSNAVANLIKVGRETINSSDDAILRQDMPASLHRVEEASRLLEDACRMLRADPFSQPARRKLIDGARGILQGTSSLLLCFDESEVRKIIKECKKVLDYLAVAGVIEDMEDLVEFVKGISPCLTKGTSSLLLCFDESEVRKIIKECKKVLDYLAVAGVIEDMEDLVEFVKGISPCLTKVGENADEDRR
ncbi:unnamed protein product, partial [Notodromas monacha]